LPTAASREFCIAGVFLTVNTFACWWSSLFSKDHSSLSQGVLASEGCWEAWQTSPKVTRSY